MVPSKRMQNTSSKIIKMSQGRIKMLSPIPILSSKGKEKVLDEDDSEENLEDIDAEHEIAKLPKLLRRRSAS